MNIIKQFLDWLIPGRVRKSVFWETGKNVGMTLEQAQEYAIKHKCGIRQKQWPTGEYIYYYKNLDRWYKFGPGRQINPFIPTTADEVSSSWVARIM